VARSATTVVGTAAAVAVAVEKAVTGEAAVREDVRRSA
jgi:hypothetical protein